MARRSVREVELEEHAPRYSRWAPWWAAWRIARRDAVRSRGRTAVVVAMIGLPVLVGVGAGVLVQSSIFTPERNAGDQLGPSAQAWLTDPEQGLPIVQDPYGAQSMPVAYPDVLVRADPASLVPEGDRIVAVHGVEGRLATDGARLSVSVRSAPADGVEATVGADLVRGFWPTRVGDVVLPAATAAALGAELGDPITVQTSATRSDDATVVGISADNPAGGPVVVDGTVPLDGSDPLGWYVVGDVPVTWADVGRLNAHGIAAISRDVLEDPPPTPPELDPLQPQTSATSVALIAAVVAIGLLEVVLVVGPAFAVGARRTARELALLAVVGGDRRTLGRVVLLRGLVAGLVASVLGVVLGLVSGVVVRAVAVARGSTEFPDLRVPWSFVGAVAVVGVLVALAAAWLPARRAGRVDVVAVLADRRAEPALRRRVPVLGAVLFLLGAVVATWAASRRNGALLVGGVLMLQLGVVAASGALIALAGRLAPRAGVATRVALRDAARQRGRTAPAVAAVIAVIGGAVAGSVFLHVQDQADRAAYRALASDGTVLVAFHDQDEFGAWRGELDTRELDDASTSISEVTGARDVVRVVAGVPREGADTYVNAAPAPGSCGIHCGDPGANIFSVAYSTSEEAEPMVVPNVLVDDGTSASIMGQPSDAVAALADGTAVVTDPTLLWPDGTAHVVVGPPTVDERTDVVPAVLGAPVGPFSVILPSAVARDAGLDTVVVGLAAVPDGAFTAADQARLSNMLDTAATVVVATGYDRSGQLMLWILVGAAVLVGIGATGLAMALAAAEIRPDLATLAAVGANPRTRRRVGAAQAGVIAGLGSVLGVIAGLVLGWVLVIAGHRVHVGVGAVAHAVPWLQVVAVLVGVPAIAIGGAYLLTRPNLPLTRRIEA